MKDTERHNYIGDHIRKLREEKGWTQQVLGKKLGKKTSTISAYETNAKLPSVDCLIEMAELFDVALSAHDAAYSDEELKAAVADCDVLLLQLEIPPSTALAAARLAKECGATVVLNASPPGTDPHLLAELAADGWQLLGDQVKTAPRGYTKDDPMIGLLRYKTLYVLHEVEPEHSGVEQATARVAELWGAVRPLLDWISPKLRP